MIQNLLTFLLLINGGSSRIFSGQTDITTISRFNSSFKPTCPSNIEGCKASNTCTYCPDSCEYCQCTDCGSLYLMCTENDCVSCNNGYSLNIKYEIDNTGSCELKSSDPVSNTDADTISDTENMSFWLIISAAIFALCTCCIILIAMICGRKKFLNKEMKRFSTPLILQNCNTNESMKKDENKKNDNNNKSVKMHDDQNQSYHQPQYLKHKKTVESELSDALFVTTEDYQSETKTSDGVQNESAPFQNAIKMMSLYGASDDNNSELTMNSNRGKSHLSGMRGRKFHAPEKTSSIEFEYEIDMMYDKENQQQRTMPTYRNNDNILLGSSIDDNDDNIILL